jgi:glucose-1-phosphate cytidylyltransferase
MKVVILCGGMGTRLREYTENIPKPLVEVGGRPILWHIMKLYSSFGYNEFILCLGYKGEMIKQYFMDYKSWKNKDFTLHLDKNSHIEDHDSPEEEWKITFVDTGLETNTGGRIRKIEKYITEEEFFATYGDGLSSINLNELLAFHRQKNKTATITCVQPLSQFGIIEIDQNSVITNFKEKPPLDHWVNGGFFVFKKEFFNYLENNSVLEKEPFERASKKGEIAAYKFKGFWKCMDTFKDSQDLNTLWKGGNAPWKINWK